LKPEEKRESLEKPQSVAEEKSLEVLYCTALAVIEDLRTENIALRAQVLKSTFSGSASAPVKPTEQGNGGQSNFFTIKSLVEHENILSNVDPERRMVHMRKLGTSLKNMFDACGVEVKKIPEDGCQVNSYPAMIDFKEILRKLAEQCASSSSPSTDIRKLFSKSTQKPTP
jgi:hypothetical protein